MRYVIFTWVHPDDVAAWESWTPEEQAADVERHRAWFRQFGDRVVGGEELDFPPTVKTLRPGRQREGVQPDLVSFAKGVTSAYLPLGGVIVSKPIHDAILEAPPAERFMHAATYSGHPTCCAVGVKTLEIYERERLIDRVPVVGKHLGDGLQALRDLPAVGDVRGFGFMYGIELVEDQRTKKPAVGLGGKVVAEAQKRGLVTRLRAGRGDTYPIGDTIFLAPPFVTTKEQIDRIVSILEDSIIALAGR